MKNIKSISICIATLLSCIYPFSSFAGIEDCPSDAIHCAYMTGLSNNNLNDGRYIKISNTKKSFIMCLNSVSVTFLDDQGAADNRGPNADKYEICADANGSNCSQIGIDNFIVSLTDSGFVSKPKYFNIDITGLKDSFPTCEALGKHPIKL